MTVNSRATGGVEEQASLLDGMSPGRERVLECDFNGEQSLHHSPPRLTQTYFNASPDALLTVGLLVVCKEAMALRKYFKEKKHVSDSLNTIIEPCATTISVVSEKIDCVLQKSKRFIKTQI